MTDQRELKTAKDVTPAILAAAEEAEEWFADRAMNWDEFWDRLDCEEFYVSDVLSPAALKIQRYVRGLRKDMMWS